MIRFYLNDDEKVHYCKSCKKKMKGTCVKILEDSGDSYYLDFNCFLARFNAVMTSEIGMSFNLGHQVNIPDSLKKFKEDKKNGKQQVHIPAKV